MAITGKFNAATKDSYLRSVKNTSNYIIFDDNLDVVSWTGSDNIVHANEIADDYANSNAGHNYYVGKLFNVRCKPVSPELKTRQLPLKG